MQGRNSRGPVGGAGPLANKGLSQRNSGNQSNGNGKERRPIFGVSGFVNAVLNKLRADNGRPLPGVFFTRDGKQTILGTELKPKSDHLTTATITRNEVRTVNYFRFTAEERFGRDYGRVYCTEKGNALPRRFLRNDGKIGEQARHYDGLIQPSYVNLMRLTVVEAIGRAAFFKVTRLSFQENSKTDFSINVAAEEFILYMPQELKERFLYADADDALDPVALEAIMMAYLKAITDNAQEFASWEPLIRPMVVAYQKACGQQDAFYLEQKNEDLELDPEQEMAEDVAEKLSAGLQATGTMG